MCDVASAVLHQAVGVSRVPSGRQWPRIGIDEHPLQALNDSLDCARPYWQIHELEVVAIMSANPLRQPLKASLRDRFARETLERERQLFPQSGLSALLKSRVDSSGVVKAAGHPLQCLRAF